MRPDVITLDMEMPEMDGLETLRQLQKHHPEVYILLVSHFTDQGADLTLKALNLGAADFVTKPAQNSSLAENLKYLRTQLLPKIRQFEPKGTWKALALQGGYAGEIKLLKSVFPRPKHREVIAIGVSTGGPQHLSNLFAQFPSDLPQAVLIVQHMPPLFTQKLAVQLNQVGTVPTHEAIDGEPVVCGKAYIAPGDFHMEVVEKGGNRCIRLHQKKPENFCRPSADVLFRSVAQVYGPKAVGVIMTGMGRDGLKGSEALRKVGAVIIAQDKATSVVWGMPGNVVKKGLADAVAPLDKIYATIKLFVA
ncbi:MAG: chemotaxis-specific protein-glutamate methyltransferase CheB [candidate division KSB1 bacterium]|nr:chemotaxis-specific protein-glutamate methyltransferase CheB [candidate division KSB1 bacterium]